MKQMVCGFFFNAVIIAEACSGSECQRWRWVDRRDGGGGGGGGRVWFVNMKSSVTKINVRQ